MGAHFITDVVAGIAVAFIGYKVSKYILSKYLKLDQKSNKTDEIVTEFLSEKILIDQIDYYYSNVIARSSKTMSECRKEKIKIKATGTDG